METAGAELFQSFPIDRDEPFNNDPEFSERYFSFNSFNGVLTEDLDGTPLASSLFICILSELFVLADTRGPNRRGNGGKMFV